MGLWWSSFTRQLLRRCSEVELGETHVRKKNCSDSLSSSWASSDVCINRFALRCYCSVRQTTAANGSQVIWMSDSFARFLELWWRSDPIQSNVVL